MNTNCKLQNTKDQQENIMIVEDASTTHSHLARLNRLVCQTQAHARQVGAMFNRVSEQLTSLEGGQDGAEGGWRRHYP